MKDEDRKRLIEYLGECWHELNCSIYHEAMCSCGKEFNRDYFSVLIDHIADSNRTFQNPADFFAVRDRLVEKGDWNEFNQWCYLKWDSQYPLRSLGFFTEYLTSKIEDGTYRLCVLVAEWLKEREAQKE